MKNLKNKIYEWEFAPEWCLSKKKINEIDTRIYIDLIREIDQKLINTTY